MQDYYTLQVAGVTRQLPIMQISDSLAIASFVILGDCEIVTKSAPLIEKQLPQVDYIVTAEAKGIPLVHELCRLRGLHGRLKQCLPAGACLAGNGGNALCFAVGRPPLPRERGRGGVRVALSPCFGAR